MIWRESKNLFAAHDAVQAYLLMPVILGVSSEEQSTHMHYVIPGV